MSDLAASLFAVAERETGGPVDPNGVMGNLLSAIARNAGNALDAENPHPPKPSTCILTDPWPFCRSVRRFHVQVYGEELPQSITTVPPEIAATIFAALKKRHPDLVKAFDFSAVDETALEVHLIILLQSMLEKGTDYAGAPLTDEQRADIYVWTGWGRDEAADETEEAAPNA